MLIELIFLKRNIAKYMTTLLRMAFINFGKKEKKTFRYDFSFFFFCLSNLGFWFTLMLCPYPWFEEIIKSFSGLNHSEGIKVLMLRICMGSMKKKTD